MSLAKHNSTMERAMGLMLFHPETCLFANRSSYIASILVSFFVFQFFSLTMQCDSVMWPPTDFVVLFFEVIQIHCREFLIL